MTEKQYLVCKICNYHTGEDDVERATGLHAKDIKSHKPEFIVYREWLKLQK